MKNIIIIALLSTLTLPLTSKANNMAEHKLFSKQGYPYNNLLRKTKEVKIHYSEKKQNINCFVSIEFNNRITNTNKISVIKEKFLSAPLKSCLKRKEAKTILAKTFN